MPPGGACPRGGRRRRGAVHGALPDRGRGRGGGGRAQRPRLRRVVGQRGLGLPEPFDAGTGARASLRYALRSLGRPDSPLYLRPSADPRFLAGCGGSGAAATSATFRRGYAAVADLNRPRSTCSTGCARPASTRRCSGPAWCTRSCPRSRPATTSTSSGRWRPGATSCPTTSSSVTRPTCWTPRCPPRCGPAYLVSGEGVVDPDGSCGRWARRSARPGAGSTRTSRSPGSGATAAASPRRCTSAGEIACSAVVVAAGMWSDRLLRRLGYRLPLQAGKGYSFTVDLDPAPPSHALYFGDRRVVASPIGGTTRIGRDDGAQRQQQPARLAAGRRGRPRQPALPRAAGSTTRTTCPG